MQVEQRQRALERLTPSIRETVDIIHALYNDGLTPQQITLNRIGQARVEQGLTAGSQRTLQRAKNEWAIIYNIEHQEKKGSPLIREALANRLIGLIEKEVEADYKALAEEKIQAAEDKASEALTSLHDVEKQKTQLTQVCEERDTTISALGTSIETLTLERDGLQNKLVAQSTELQVQTATLNEKLRYITELEKQLVSAKALADDIKQSAESQRADFMARVDALETQNKSLLKEKSQITDKLHKVELTASEVRAENSALKITVHDKDADMDVLYKKQASLQDAAEYLKQQKGKSDSDNAVLKTHLETTQSQMKELQQRCHHQDKEKQQLMRLFEQAQGEIESLRKAKQPRKGKQDA